MLWGKVGRCEREGGVCYEVMIEEETRGGAVCFFVMRLWFDDEVYIGVGFENRINKRGGGCVYGQEGRKEGVLRARGRHWKRDMHPCTARTIRYDTIRYP